jgi:hypothetical protein
MPVPQQRVGSELFFNPHYPHLVPMHPDQERLAHLGTIDFTDTFFSY